DLKRRDAEPKKVRWGALTREERNERRRQQYQARRAIERQNPAAEARSEHRLAAAQQIALKSSVPTAEESARKWAEYRQMHGPGPTAEESAKNWKAFRESQKLPEAPQPLTTRVRDRGAETSAEIDDTDGRSHPDLGHDLGL